MTDPFQFKQHSREVTIKGLKEIQEKLDIDFLAQPEFNLALETFKKRIERKSKGLGAQRNTLMSATAPLSVNTESTLNYPRTTGAAWQKKMHGVIQAMAPRVMKKAVQRIEARWAISNRGGFGS